MIKYAVTAYTTIVLLGFINGAWQGDIQYTKWRRTRRQVTIDSELYDPIVNICRDTGYWGFNVLQGGFGSAIIVATAPVSIPMMLNGAKYKPENDDR